MDLECPLILLIARMRPTNRLIHHMMSSLTMALKTSHWQSKATTELVKYGRPVQILSDLQLHSVDHVDKYVPRLADHLIIHGSLGFSKNHPSVQNFYEEVSKRFEKVVVVPKVASLPCYEVPKLNNVCLMDCNSLLIDPYTVLVRYPCVTNDLPDSIMDQCVDSDLSIILVDETFHNESRSLVPFYGSYIRGILRPNLWNISFNKRIDGIRHVSWNPRSFQSKKTVPVLY